MFEGTKEHIQVQERETHNFSRLGKSPSSEGIVPVSALSCKVKYLRLVRFVQACPGMVPDNLP